MIANGWDRALQGPRPRGVLRLHDPRRFGAVVHVLSVDDPRALKLLGGLVGGGVLRVR